MDNSFDVLEDKVRKAAELVKRLRKDNHALEEDLGKAKARLLEAEKRLTALEKERESGGAQLKELDGLGREVKALRQEREAIRDRISKLVEVLEELD